MFAIVGSLTEGGLSGLVSRVLSLPFLLTFAGLLGSHGISFYKHYLVGGEREKATVETLMLAPYKRIVLLHVAIIVGATPVMLLRSPLPLLLLLIGGKTYLDLRMHKKSHAAVMDEEAAAGEME